MSVTGWKVLACIFVLAFILRFWGAFDVKDYTDDEYVQVPSAISLFKYGTTAELQWVHPPMSSIVLYGTIKALGNNPYGWRIGNIVFGSVAVIMLFLVGRILYPGSAVPLLAAAMLALDPFHIDLSRTTFMEIPTSLFFLLYLYFMLQYTEQRKNTLVLAGVALGLTIATKAYYIFTIPMVAVYSLYRLRQRGELTLPVVMDFILVLLVLPLCIYFVTFIQWFGRGYTLPDFIQMKNDAVWVLKNITLSYFHASNLIIAGGKPWQWFLKPISFGYQTFSDGVKGSYILVINNFPFRMLTIPALILVITYAWKKRAWHEFLVPLLFVTCYVLYLVVDRPVFSTNAVVLLPFAYLAVAQGVVVLAQKLEKEKLVYIAFVSLVFVWGIYTYPLVTGIMVSESMYRPIISMTKIMTTGGGH